jgi:hypothetical protein
MFVTYSPAEGDVQEFTFYPRRLRLSEQERIEKQYGGTFGQWSIAINQGDAKARRILLWFLLTREHGIGLRPADVDPLSEEIEIRWAREEFEAFGAAQAKAGADDRLIEATAAEAERAESDPALVGKALSPIDA